MYTKDDQRKIRATLAREMYTRRQRLEYSLEYLALVTDCSPSCLYYYERGNRCPSPKVLAVLASELEWPELRDPDQWASPVDPSRSRIALLIERRMQEKGVSVHDLERAQVVSRSTVLKILRGFTIKPRLRTCQRLEQALEMPEGTLTRIVEEEARG